ncbi:MAG: tetratricopeptide repeat protein [Candidatus Kapabacteria bacterium]|nr:tetratricopeptide repeat protein [Candidatus Kapabacteria bacterium]
MNHSSFTRAAALGFVSCCIITLVTSEIAFSQAPRRPTQRSTSARPAPPVRTSSPKAMLDEAQRALKLGSSYREARNFDLAQKYIQRGIELANKAGNRYWEATGYEYLGLVYRDIGDRDAALSALQKASDMFTGIIKQPNGSQNSTQALMDDVRRNDRSRPPANTSLGSAPPAPPRTDLERERTLNRQLNERIAALETKIRALEDRSALSVSPGASPVIVSPSTPPPQVRASESSPGVIARTMPRQAPDGGQPQAEFAPFQTEKKTRPEPQKRPEPTPARAVVMDVITLPTFTLQIGIGAGYNLNTKAMTTRLPTTSVEGAVNGFAPLVSFPLLSISGDFFLSPNFSLGLMYGYYPGPDQTTTSTITTGTPSATTSLTTRTTTSYHLVTLRPSVHFVRDRNVDVYVGLALGTLVNLPLFDPLRLYAGLMAGFQYNFTRQVGMFLELSGGGIYVGDSSVEKVLLTTPGNPLIQVGAYGRLGIAINF